MASARDEELALLFRDARTHNVWLDQPVSDDLLRQVYDLARMGPTGGNANPLRVGFVKSAEAKARLLASVAPQNVDKVRTAPVTAILAYDRDYHERLLQLFPSRPEFYERFSQMPVERRNRVGEQSALLAAGYFVIAARAVGLDVGPIGGFDAGAVDAAFFPEGGWRSMLLVNLGYGDASRLYPRNPRLSFDEACRII